MEVDSLVDQQRLRKQGRFQWRGRKLDPVTSYEQGDSWHNSQRALPSHLYMPHPSTLIPLNSSPNASLVKAAYKFHLLEQLIHLQVERVKSAPVNSQQHPANQVSSLYLQDMVNHINSNPLINKLMHLTN